MQSVPLFYWKLGIIYNCVKILFSFCCVTFDFWLVALVFCSMMDFGLGCYRFHDVTWRITHNTSLLVVDYGIIVVEGGVGFETLNELASLETSEEILQAKAQVQ